MTIEPDTLDWTWVLARLHDNAPGAPGETP